MAGLPLLSPTLSAILLPSPALMLSLQRMNSADLVVAQRLYGLNGAQQIKVSHVVSRRY